MTIAETHPVLPGCDSFSHVADGTVGVVVLHGFTANPSSMRGVAEAMIAAGLDVELPRLPGHGTHVDDMVATRWADWYASALAAADRLTARVQRTVIVGQSMGGTIALALALARPSIDRLVCINPATRPRSPDEMQFLDDLLDDGVTVVPGDGGPDIADPESTDSSYAGTPLAAARSFMIDGVEPISDRFGELTMPLRLLTSREDHVVPPDDSVHLAATYGGPVEHTWLDRSFHVATRDYDRELVVAESVAFAAAVIS